ncbi:hypothetical protein KW786_01285 [Candidatus Parcubacteria bacterium]|nr:hypothetical protein [Candidatus Parcubacteria bacterium]
MNPQPTEAACEVIVWDYDAAPDGGEIVVYEVRRFASRTKAKNYAWWMVNGDVPFVGAAVIRDGALICSYGLNCFTRSGKESES